MIFLFEPLCLDILVAAGSLIALLYGYFTWTFDYWKKRGVPYVKPEPIFGNIKDQVLMRVSEGLVMTRLYQQLEGHKFGGGFQFRRPFILLRDPEFIKQFTLKDFPSFHDRGLIEVKGTSPMNANLFNLPGTRWSALRTKLTPTFTSSKMKMMYQLMAECSEQLRHHLAEPARRGEELEMREVLAKFTTDVIGTCALGLQFNSMSDPNSEFRRMGRTVFESSLSNSIRRLVLIFLPPLARLLGLGFASDEFEKFFLNAVKETVAYREKNNVERNDLLQLLIQIKNKVAVGDDQDIGMENAIHNGIKGEDQIEMTDSLLAAQLFIIFLAGFETTSTAMSFALLELALNPDIQTRLRNEVDSVLQEHGGELTLDALHDMHYLDKVVSESLRKYPPVNILVRVCTKRYTIPGTELEVEEGTRVIIPVRAIHHDPMYYPEPERFDPERFNMENKAKRPNYTYLPFGEGPRTCIGKRFALIEVKKGLATLVRHYIFSPCKRTVVPVRYDPRTVVTSSLDGVWLKITHRE